MNIKKFFSGKKSYNNSNYAKKTNLKKGGAKSLKKLWIILGVIATLFFIAFFIFNNEFNKIVPDGGNVFGSMVKMVTSSDDLLKGEEEGRINIALLGMRGEGVVGGGTLADTIMVVSLKIDKDSNNPDADPKYTASMVSIPRDLFVIIPGTNEQAKINAVYARGEQKDHGGGGIKLMKQILEDVSGQRIHYAMAVNFNGFKQIVDALNGVDVDLEKEFTEYDQFHELKVCDGDKGGVFTVKSGEFEYKKNEKGKVVAQYPLCYNKDEECGGIFKVPAGKSTLDGENALCYVRARVNTSDFDRAKRQQEVIKQLKNKALAIGFFSDFDKIMDLKNAVGDNVALDMGELWEMKRFYEIYKKMGDIEVKQKVLDSSEAGMLYSPPEGDYGYILLPRGESYDKIREMFTNIFN